MLIRHRMVNSLPSPESASSLDDLLAEVRATARDQLHAASQLQLDRLHEQMGASWHDDLDRIMEERLADAASRIENWHQAESGPKLAEVAAQARLNARRDLSEQLGRAVRRLREFESEEQWSQVLLDGTKGFCERAAVFIVNGQSLQLRGTRGMERQILAAVPLASAPAFASAVETKDTLIAMRTRGELSEPVAALVGESPGHRSSLFPITPRDRVAAILYADSVEQEMEPAALEMLCAVGSAVLEGLAAHGRQESNGLVKVVGSSAVTGEPARAESPRVASWFALNRDQQNLHLRAQRAARVLVAEMRLYKAPAVNQGRAERNLYARLRSEIDSGRETFRAQFFSQSDSMVDYLHVELLRSLANDDTALLGPEYPGPMA